MKFEKTVFWWVNQNQTFKHERTGGYMWSPKCNKNGATNQFYNNMTEVSPGDVIFSFARQKIPAIGIVTSNGYEATKPREFGAAGDNWEKVGWKVDVKYFDLINLIRPKDYIDDLRPTLPKKYSPLQDNGNGLQSVYLTSVPKEMARVIIHNIGPEAIKILQDATSSILSEEEQKEIEEKQIEDSILQNTSINETEKETVVKARRGQGRYRKNLEAIEKQCRVTGVSNPNHLIASHIKPWAKCESNTERIDGHNGLMLAPHIDHLFDRGYISFSDGGDLLVSTYADLQALSRMGIQVEQEVNVGLFSTEQKAYLSYHREVVFKTELA